VPGASIAQVEREHRVNAFQVFQRDHLLYRRKLIARIEAFNPIGRLRCFWHLCRTEGKGPLLRIGLRVTCHPRMGAAQQPEVAVRELYENKQLIEKWPNSG
jgi:hypothetical protein